MENGNNNIKVIEPDGPETNPIKPRVTHRKYIIKCKNKLVYNAKLGKNGGYQNYLDKISLEEMKNDFKNLNNSNNDEAELIGLINSSITKERKVRKCDVPRPKFKLNYEDQYEDKKEK